jgi:hypothetical protein
MDALLRISSTLEHDGDGCVSFALLVSNNEFSASTWVWADKEAHLQLSRSLKGFPLGSDPAVTEEMGTGGIGRFRLHFGLANKLGLIAVRVEVEGHFPIANGEEHDHATIHFRCEPAAVDTFVMQLEAFRCGEQNCAELSGVGP